MFLLDLLVALFFAVLLSAGFALLIGLWRPTERGGYGALLYFFLVVWLGTFVVGAWVRPAGPSVWGVPWLLFLFVSVVIALLVAAAEPLRRRHAAAAAAAVTETAAVTVFGMFFWVLLMVLMIGALARYTWVR